MVYDIASILRHSPDAAFVCNTHARWVTFKYSMRGFVKGDLREIDATIILAPAQRIRVRDIPTSSSVILRFR